MKQPFYRVVSIVCAFTLAASLVPAPALADGGGEPSQKAEISKIDRTCDLSTVVALDVAPESIETSASVEVLASLFDARSLSVPLKSGQFEKWIDRINATSVVRGMYDTLVEATDNDGIEDYLIEDRYLEGAAESDAKYHVVRDAEGVARPCLIFCSGRYTPDDTDEMCSRAEEIGHCICMAYSAFDRDYPDVFWVAPEINYAFLVNKAEGILYGGIYIDDRMRVPQYSDESTLKKSIESRDVWVQDIFNAAPPSNDPEGRVRFFNEWLTKSNEYNTSEDLSSLYSSGTYNDAWECISALEGREGDAGPVCEAYARAFKLLCDRSGISCVLVDGTAISSTGSGGRHMWNYTKLGDDWYAVDSTWNDPRVKGVSGKLSGYEREDYLLVGANTQVGGMPFIESHPVTNSLITGYAFPNGPELSAEKYVRDCGKMGHVTGGTMRQNIVPATCEKNETYDEVTTCKYCQGAMATKKVETPDTAMGHLWDEAWLEVRPATCLASGEEQRVCVRDGSHTEKRPIPATGHKMSAWETVKAATCDEPGSQQRGCSQAGCSYVEEQSQPALEHKWGKWVEQAPACTKAGKKVRVCERDESHVDTVVIPAPGHTVESGKIEGATCTEDGFKSGVCSVCGSVDKQVVLGSALGHSWGAWRVAASATCTVSGVEERTCSRDGSHHDTRVIPAIGHAMGSWTTVRPATCTVPGAEQRRCTHAGCAYSETRATAATGHAFGAYCPNGDAKVGVNGTETATCSKCGARTTRTAAGSALAPAVGQTVSAGGASFAVTGAATVTYAGPASKTATSATVPATVKVSGRTYKVTSISPKAFAGNKRLKSVKIGANVTAVPNGAFSGCTKLTSVSFGNGISSVGSKAFYGCKSLKLVTLGSKVTSIGTSAFQNCSKLAKVTVKSKSLKSIGKSAFAGCKKLKAVTLKTTKLKSVGKNAFKGTAKKLTVKVPKAKVRAYQKLFKSKGSKTVRVKK